MLSSLNERRLGVSKLVYIENDLSTSAEVIGAYFKHEKSLSVMSLGNPRFFIFFSSPDIICTNIRKIV